MEQDRWEALLEGILNDTLEPGQEQELLLALQQDPAREAQLLQLLEQEELLSAALNPARAAESYEEQVRLRVQGRDGAPFVKAVLDRARRVASRNRGRMARTMPRADPWKVALVAAALLIGTVALVAVLSSPGDGNLPDKPARRRMQAAEEVRTRAEEKRGEMEARLREIEQKRQAFSEPPSQPVEDPADEEKRKRTLEALRNEKDRIEQDMMRTIELARKTAPPGSTEPPRDSPAIRELPPSAKTEAGIAQLEEAAGEAFVVTREGKLPAKSGTDLARAQGLETGNGASRIVLRFPDRTRLELGRDTTVTEIAVEPGKRVIVAKGTVRAVVVKQPKDQPMVFATPHGEAKVLGTTLRLIIDPDPRKGTRLEVEEGKVQLRDLAGKTIDVLAGHYAVAAAGIEVAAKPMTGESTALELLAGTGEVTISFGPRDQKLPPGVLTDFGEPFDLKRGYGWVGPNPAVKVPGLKDTVFRRRPHRFGGTDDQDLRASHINVGDADHTEGWFIKAPKGRYLVTVCVGGYDGGAVGPHHVQIEGAQAIDTVKTQPGEFVERKDMPVEVKDGVLRMVIGGHRRKDSPHIPWYSNETAVSFIRIRKSQP